MSNAEPFSTDLRGPRFNYAGDRLLQIALPLGGIGAGCVCLNGYGGLQDYSIRNHPFVSADQDTHGPGDAAFALLHFPKQGLTRLVEGPFPVEKKYNLGLKSQGHRAGGHEGLPRFRNCNFTGEYPFGSVFLSDPLIPLKIRITGYNPFIPLDDKNSGIPCAILEYTLENPGQEDIEYQFSYHLSHLADGSPVKLIPKTYNREIPGSGAFLFNQEPPNSTKYGSAALGVVGYQPEIKAMWFRGAWFDAISALWREVSTGTFQANDGSNPDQHSGRNGASILLKGTLTPGQTITYPIVITWYFPNVDEAIGQELKPEVNSGQCGPECSCNDQSVPPKWRPYYASQWMDAQDVFLYVKDHYSSLRQRTQAFHDALFSSTLPDVLLEAISANLAILKSPTILRQENGNLWGWEGCFADRGCCHGSCTHVWNYAQSIPHLFPMLERTLREQELIRSMNDRGHVNFRSALPDGPTYHDFHAASDGQLGGIMKVYREWQISGDRDWANKMYAFTRRSMDFCIATWDPDHRGVVEEPHHNTYDIEFWGPDGMATSFYIAALTAMATLAIDLGHPQDAVFYKDLAQKGAGLMDEQLFNGEYYHQVVDTLHLHDQSFAEKVAQVNDQSSPEDQLLKKEGPKYQYGSGCLADEVFGAWLGKLCFIEPPQNEDHIRSTLASIFKYNFKEHLWDHANTQRPGYAWGDEPGLLLCTWPKGGKPTLPFPYSDEVWTGIEHQVASHLIAVGLVDEGIQVVSALRSRFDGHVRNPWNEYECGNYYARAMSSYALLIAASGFRYSAPQKALYFNPKMNADPFQCFISTATGWGSITLTQNQLIIDLVEGYLNVDKLFLVVNGHDLELEVTLQARAGAPTAISLTL